MAVDLLLAWRLSLVARQRQAKPLWSAAYGSTAAVMRARLRLFNLWVHDKADAELVSRGKTIQTSATFRHGYDCPMHASLSLDRTRRLIIFLLGDLHCHCLTAKYRSSWLGRFAILEYLPTHTALFSGHLSGGIVCHSLDDLALTPCHRSWIASRQPRTSGQNLQHYAMARTGRSL